VVNAVVGLRQEGKVESAMNALEAMVKAKMNRTAVAELALAVAVTQMDLFNRRLGTVPLEHGQFLLALGSAVLLIALWEAGKLIARRRQPAP
jgi:P-type Ca2+ transporter type 2C